MYFNFSNDFRINNFPENLYNAANKINIDTIPNSSENKSENNHILTLQRFFAIQKDSNILKLLLQRNARAVVINFIKKFQYPNILGRNDFKKYIDNEICFAPLRTIVRLLYIAYTSDGEEAFLTREEVMEYLFLNENISKRKNFNLVEVYELIKENRKLEKQPDWVRDLGDYNLIWKDWNRQIREMMKVLIWSNCIKNQGKDDSSYQLNILELTIQEKSDLFDILTKDIFWKYPIGEPNARVIQSYYDYMEMASEEKHTKVEYLEEEPNKEEYLQDTLRVTEAKNKIYYGAPGTGKSHLVQEKYPDFNRVTFHPEYTYFDFVGSLRPVQKDGDISYEFVPGPFTDVLIGSLWNETKMHGLILEEINRSNAAAVFGDLFQLLDRDEIGRSKYDIINKDLLDYIEKKKGIRLKSICIPSNFSIIATMNSADQGVYVMDSAFKRRWEFEYIPIEFSNSANARVKVAGFDIYWEQFATILNDYLSNIGVEEDKLIGPYSINDKELQDKNKVASKLLIYLWDDVVKYQRSKLFGNIKRFSDLVAFYNEEKDIFVPEVQQQLNEIKSVLVTDEGLPLSEKNEEPVVISNVKEGEDGE